MIVRDAGKKFWVSQLGFICGLLLLLGSAPAGASEDFVALTTGSANSSGALYFSPIEDGTLGNIELVDDVTPAGHSSNAVGVADFDGDEENDIILAHGSTGEIYLYLKNGSDTSPFVVPPYYVGTFDRCHPDIGGGCGAQKMAVGDFNRDGKMDFVVSGYNTLLKIYLGNGDGTFEEGDPGVGITNPGNGIMFGKDAEDVDGDGYMDLVVATHRGDYLQINELWFWPGKKSTDADPSVFDAPRTIYNDTDIYNNLNIFGRGVVIEDYDCDGNVDILLTMENPAVFGDGNATSFYLMSGDGNGGFASPSTFYPFSWGYDNVYPDMDRYYLSYHGEDSIPDVIISLTYGANSKINTISSQGSCGSFDIPVRRYYPVEDMISIATPRAPLCIPAGEVGDVTIQDSVIPVDPGTTMPTIAAEASYSGPNMTALWNWGDGEISAGDFSDPDYIQGSKPSGYANPGVYTVTLEVTDDCGTVITRDFRYVVVYDPSEGFVTGGGWVLSPVGAYKYDETLTGKANFGFVSKYKKGATTPTGQTLFQFQVADLNFHSDNYDWLVVAGAKAQYKGTGTINGMGNFGFLISAIDEAINDGEEVDRFRIKIWDKDDGDQIVYDNNISEDDDDADPTTEIGGGSIVIHN
jgi:hypothetical protein